MARCDVGAVGLADWTETMTEQYDKPKTESTWMLGVLAFRSGKSIQSNPYATHDLHDHHKRLDHNGWENGWVFARSEWAKKQP
jgi:nicotinamide mononucleotide adenylyltransferase